MPEVTTGNKTFDRVGYVSTGNVESDCQRSGFVRPFTETECNGFTRKPGELQEWDLRAGFCKPDMPAEVKRFIRETGKTATLCAYLFFHWRGSRKIVHGWIVTDYHHKPLRTWYASNRAKSVAVIRACAKVLAAS
jgi:hypothetical protein